MIKFVAISVPLVITGLIMSCFAGQGGVAGYFPLRPGSGSLMDAGAAAQYQSNDNFINEDIGYSGDASIFKYYVTPRNGAVKDLLARVNGPEEVYRLATQWVYVPDSILNGTADKWLTPGEFLTGTPDYPNNHLKGKPVSDCEEQANTLVSLLRAMGIGPGEVRAVAGRVLMNGRPTGHVWVELRTSDRWLALDPTYGPYWDDAAGKLVPRDGLTFNYYADHAYPALEVWDYYNDVYQTGPGDGVGYAPAAWYGR